MMDVEKFLEPIVFPVTYRGIEFLHIKNPMETEGVFALDNQRWILTGQAEIILMNEPTGQYGKQIQFKIISPKEIEIKPQLRNPSKWNTIEIAVPLDIGKKILERNDTILSETNGSPTKGLNREEIIG